MFDYAGFTPRGIIGHMKDIKAEFEKPTRALPSSRSLEKYTYKGLSDPTTEIRLLNLLPGANDDPIIAQIDHARLTDPGNPTKPGLSQKLVDDITQSLPSGWRAAETWSQRLIYFNAELGLSSWDHPGGEDSVGPQEDTSGPAPEETADIPHYEALSYTWGDPKSRHTIYIQKPDGEHTKISVTKNLALALRDLRSTTEKRTLWIDAVCINQGDMQERNTQVKRMTSIYKLAHRVVVWLGQAIHSSGLAISTIDYLGEQLEVSRNGTVIPTPGAAEPNWYKGEVDLPYDANTWNAMLRLFLRPYFVRIWIIQELHLSNHRTLINCGSHSTSWLNLRKALQCFYAKQNVPTPMFRSDSAKVRELASYDARRTYQELTVTVSSRLCSNDRDRVYGLLGLMPEGLRDRITPDYELTVGEVYKQETVAQIEFFQRLDVLKGCGPHRATDGPSWVPNLTLPHWEINRTDSASGVSRCYVAFDNPKVAEVTGLQVGTVGSVQKREPWTWGEGINHTKAWAHQDLDRDVYALTLCGMFVRDRWQETPSTAPGQSPASVPSLEEWKRYYYGGKDSGQEIPSAFWSYVERCVFKRTLFTMDDGQIGLGPETMKAGDAVCIFLGCDAPIVIRQQSDETYQVVGDAVAYALRDAQGLLGPLPEPWRTLYEEYNSRPIYRFLNRETGEKTENDPRLGPLTGWERLDADMGGDDPRNCQKYKNIETGEVINYDPRMSLEALEARGVKLTTFSLS